MGLCHIVSKRTYWLAKCSGLLAKQSRLRTHWACRPFSVPAWATAAALADRGILVAPGDFYGERGASHVRLALTAPDDVIAIRLERS